MQISRAVQWLHIISPWQTTCSFLCALHCTVALCGVDASVVCAMGDVKSLLHISDWYKSVVYRKVSISTNAMLKVKTTTLWKHQGAVWRCLANLAVRCEQCPCSGGGHRHPSQATIQPEPTNTYRAKWQRKKQIDKSVLKVVRHLTVLPSPSTRLPTSRQGDDPLMSAGGVIFSFWSPDGMRSQWGE